VAVENFLPTAALAATVLAIVNLLRYARGRDWNGVLTQLTVWGSGVAGVSIFAQSAWGEAISLGGALPLSKLGWASLVIVGLQVGSAATVVNEFRGAIDRSTTTAKPRLLTGNTVRLVDSNERVVVDPPPPVDQ
jgi:hypothetical protein